MRAWDLDVLVILAERDMGGNTLGAWANKFAGTGTSQTCRGKEEFKVTTVGAGELLTREVLKTDFHTIACLEAGFVHWCVGVVVTFTTLTGRTETLLTERLDKTALKEHAENINSTFPKMSHRNFTDCMIYRNGDTFIPSTKRRIKNGTLTNNYRNRFSGRYVRRFSNRFNKRLTNRFIGWNTGTIRNMFMGRYRY